RRGGRRLQAGPGPRRQPPRRGPGDRARRHHARRRPDPGHHHPVQEARHQAGRPAGHRLLVRRVRRRRPVGHRLRRDRQPRPAGRLMVARLADKVRAVLALLGPLGAGSQALLLRLLARFGRAWVFGGVAITVFALVRYRTAIAWVLAVWCAAAWMHAPGPAREDTADAGEQQAPEAPEDPFPGMVWDLIGDAPGVHIKRIVEWLHDTGLDPACTPADVTAGLTRRGIPIRASV